MVKLLFRKAVWVEHVSENVFSLPLPLYNHLWKQDCGLWVIFPQDFEDDYFIVLKFMITDEKPTGNLILLVIFF